MNMKIMLKKIAEINNKADKNHTHTDMTREITQLKQKVGELESVINTMVENLLYFEEIDKKQ